MSTAHSQTFLHPRSGPSARLVNGLVGCGFLRGARRAVVSHLPFVPLRSDIVHVVYITWVVPAGSVRDMLPAGVRIREENGKTLFSILTFEHGHFGPAGCGALRSLCPSPFQSNWRLYVEELPGGLCAERTVLFLANVLSSSVHAVGARLFSDAMPVHLARAFSHTCSDGRYETRIDSGSGSAPDLRASLLPADCPRMPPAFATFFGGWEQAVEFLTLQHASVAFVPDIGRLCHAGIDLPIDLASVQPLRPTSLESLFVHRLQPLCDPLCFVVPQVSFTAKSERLL